MIKHQLYLLWNVFNLLQFPSNHSLITILDFNVEAIHQPYSLSIPRVRLKPNKYYLHMIHSNLHFKGFLLNLLVIYPMVAITMNIFCRIIPCNLLLNSSSCVLTFYIAIFQYDKWSIKIFNGLTTCIYCDFTNLVSKKSLFSPWWQF